MEGQRQSFIPWDLIISKLKGELTEQEAASFALWMEVKEHQQIFQELSLLWNKIQECNRSYEPDREFYWKELSNRLGWQNEASEVPEKRSFLRTLYRYAAVAACVLFLAGGAFYAGRMHKAPTEVRSLSYQSVGGKSKVILPDGTLVWLHAQSELTYDTDFGSDNRSVSLDGEAYFEVTSNKEKPFIVHAGELGVKVYGTKFNVDAASDKEKISVSLIEGLVALNAGQENRFLQPGETGVYNRLNHSLTISEDDVHFASSWARDRLVFVNRPLGEVARFLSKWYQTTIYVDPQLAQKYAYTFTLQNEPLEEIVRLMSRIHPFEYHFDDQSNLFIQP